MTVIRIRVAYLFSGMGGAAIAARHVRKALETAFGTAQIEIVCVGAIDVDPTACALFTELVGTKATRMDLFSLEQYRAYHKAEPPAGWREQTAADLRAVFGEEPIDIVVTSPPCQGASPLISDAKALEPKYEALNGLSERGIALLLEAYADCPPAFILLENVPGLVKRRGKGLLAKIDQRFAAADYSSSIDVLDLGEVGALSQTRTRLHMVARHRKQLPHYVHRPPMHALRPIRDVIQRLPLPGDAELKAAEACFEAVAADSGASQEEFAAATANLAAAKERALGRLHYLPFLQIKTWIRLALIKPGCDWRYLNTYRVGPDGHLLDWQMVQLGPKLWQIVPRTPAVEAVPIPRVDPGASFPNQYGVLGMEDTSLAITGNDSVGGSARSVADDRFGNGWRYDGRQYGVVSVDSPAAPITGNPHPGGGPRSIADERVESIPGWHRDILGVNEMADTFGVITGRSINPTCGSNAIADLRIPDQAWRAHSGAEGGGVLGVKSLDATASAVTGKATQPASGAHCIADPRPGERRWNQSLAVIEDTGPASTVVGAIDPGSSWGIADVRLPQPRHGGALGVLDMGQASTAITGELTGPGCGAFALADPRLDREAFKNHYHVTGPDEAMPPVIGRTSPVGGCSAIADPRIEREGAHYNQLHITELDGTAPPVTGQLSPLGGCTAIADPRLDEPRHGGRLRVMGQGQSSPTIIGELGPAAGCAAIADPRTGGPATHGAHLNVADLEDSAPPVCGRLRPPGTTAIADPRTGDAEAFHHYLRVADSDEPAGCVSGTLNRSVIADPRPDGVRHNNVCRVAAEEEASPAITAGRTPTSGGMVVADSRLPDLGSTANDIVIISRWNLWHRPVTLLEAAGLQALFDLDDPKDFVDAVERAGASLGPDKRGKPQQISVSALAQHVGNAIPPPAMAAVFQQVVDARAKSLAGETFSLGETEIWVAPQYGAEWESA